MSTPVLATTAGRDGWEAIVNDPAGAVIASDFDGTLSPLVEDPAMSRAADGALDALARLARSVGQVAIVTGRPALVATELVGRQRARGSRAPRSTGALRAGALGGVYRRVTSDPVPAGVAVARERLPGVLQCCWVCRMRLWRTRRARWLSTRAD